MEVLVKHIHEFIAKYPSVPTLVYKAKYEPNQIIDSWGNDKTFRMELIDLLEECMLVLLAVPLELMQRFVWMYQEFLSDFCLVSSAIEGQAKRDYLNRRLTHDDIPYCLIWLQAQLVDCEKNYNKRFNNERKEMLESIRSLPNTLLFLKG